MAGVLCRTGRYLRRKNEKVSGADMFQAQWQAYFAEQGVTSGENHGFYYLGPGKI